MAGILSRSAAATHEAQGERETKITDNANKPSAQGHNADGCSDGLHQHVFHGGKGKPEMPGERLEEAVAQQRSRHCHGADPACDFELLSSWLGT